MLITVNEAAPGGAASLQGQFQLHAAGVTGMLLLTHVLLILWISSVGGQGRHCDFPKINHGILYNEKKYKASFPVSLGKIFYYSCEYNYMPPSKYFWTPITCTEGGWSPTPKCLRVCFFPFVENGQSASSGQIYLEGATVQITCNKGYSLPDNQGSITCAEGGWSSPPECISTKKCLKTDIVVANGFLSESEYAYSVNKETQYKCKPGYTTADGKTSGTVQCLQGGWSSQPTCIKSCERPVLVNARVKMDFTWFQLNDMLNYECDAGYKNQDGHTTGSIVCGEDGWSHLPICRATNQLKRCEKPRFYTRSQLSSHMYEFNHNARVSYKCAGKSTYIQTVCIDGKWDPEPDCLGKKKPLCPPPPQIPNAQNMLTTVNYQEGEKVAVLCKENHAFLEAKELVCRSGRWQSLPHCVESGQYCGPPPPIGNGDITSFPLSAYPPGSNVQYRCQSFYELRGNLTVTCRNGRWSEPPACIDACIISEDRMNKNNIQLKWRNPPKRYAKTGDFIEFECKHSHKERTPIQSFRVLCQEGKFEYPACE
ncbi:complement factor H-related protein 5-like isoform X5 [Bos indicus x Bos taurus]|uniref:complement factor H-related protein 5-like isoform X5 n=1 Tax=Bos indicus x Bos taurus TaxID=30522 RepID=UPI000F7D40A6|nr:complement factor H-related protein 5-like isoform X5 [Bos indicus x Bos taurus]